MSGSLQQPPGADGFGKYTILEFLGKGGMAEVYKAKLHGIGGFEKILVIKKILPHLASRESFIRMFFDEAKITVALQHPNIVQVFDLGEIGGTYYMTMEYVEGCNLNVLVTHCLRKKTKVPFKHILFIIMEVCKALHYAHRAADDAGVPLNVIHRDVTHSNILLSFAGDVKLADFGIARARIQESIENPGMLKGKLSYMAPEMLRAEAIDPRVDIFSLGIVFFELLSMQKLIQGKGDDEVMKQILGLDIAGILQQHPTIPEDVQDVLRKALAVDRDSRYRSAQEMFTDLNDFIFNHGVQISPHDFADFVSEIVREKKSIVGTEAEAERRDSSPGPSDLFKVESTSREKLAINVGLMDSFRPDPALLAAAVPAKKSLPPEAGLKAEHAGEIGGFLFPRLLGRLAAAGRSGRLNLTVGSARKTVFFKDGGITAVFSSLDEESIERYLIEHTTLDLQEIEEAASLQRDDAVVRHFLEAGKITMEQAARTLLSAYRDRLSGVMGAPGGLYEFTEDMEVPESILEAPLPAFNVLMAAFRRGLKVEDGLVVLERFLDRVLEHVENPRLPLDLIPLSEEELAALGRIPMGGTVREILGAVQGEAERTVVVRLLVMLYQFELIRFREPAPPAAGS